MYNIIQDWLVGLEFNVVKVINCLEGSTERSDDNRGRSPRGRLLQ